MAEVYCILPFQASFFFFLHSRVSCRTFCFPVILCWEQSRSSSGSRITKRCVELVFRVATLRCARYRFLPFFVTSARIRCYGSHTLLFFPLPSVLRYNLWRYIRTNAALCASVSLLSICEALHGSYRILRVTVQSHTNVGNA